MSAESITLQSCWREIGIQGDRSCKELASVGHCWNCPVYSSAARQLLRVMKADSEIDEGTDEVIHDEVSRGTAFVVFALNGEKWALDARVFREIHRVVEIYPLPHRADALLEGISVIRGEVLTIVRLQRLLGGSESVDRQLDLRRLLVIAPSTGPIGFVVDGVIGLQRYQPGQLEFPPASIAQGRDSLVMGMLPLAGASAAVLSPDKLFSALERGLA